MKFWFGSDGKSAGGKRFFARVEEVMVDKDGKPVYKPTPSQVVEPKAPAAPAPAAPAPVAPAAVEPAPAPVAAAPAEAKNDSALASALSQVLSKVDVIIDLLARQSQPQIIIREVVAGSTVVETAPAAQPAAVQAPLAEVAPVEEAPAEEVVEEVAVTEEAPVEEAPVEAVVVIDAPAEEVAPVEEAPVEEVSGEVAKAPAVRSRSFAEKMRDADEILQDRYDELKNYALRFRKLKSRISKKFDSINQGRFQFVKLSVAGKTLKLYLNMDINTTDPKFHCKDMSDKKTYVTVPTMLRIKSGRAVKYAKMLIDQCAEQYGMLERRKPFVVDAMQLIEESLAGNEPVDVDVDTDEVAMGDAE